MKTLIYGAGLLGRKAYSILKSRDDLKIVGFLDDAPLMTESLVCGIPVIGQGRDLRRLMREGIGAICTTLFDGEARIEISRLCERIGFEIIAAISPESNIDPEAVIGTGNIISENVSIGKGVVVGDCCFIAPGIRLGIGENVEDGTNLQIMDSGSTPHKRKNITVLSEDWR
ncbi:MAG: hypothetical protein KOO63_00710 [Bacteroidales bacterium]|nr:hypothetical protein [Candidatus Latescibacterota bacterium]